VEKDNDKFSLTTTGSPLERLAEAVVLEHNGLMIPVHAGLSETHRRLVPGGPPLEAEDAAPSWPEGTEAIACLPCNGMIPLEATSS